ncbi:TetR/AcrR family transcriptional regulator [Sandaracinobacteroides hominis]|uniref:TetR/AcrR family transcriptional regulator n=1 Tax=Sandaracinobacteroides hominis TaxID=2780086 RepID=UPI0018F53749|nr:TetR/AcrR family transcriptional regulator [Sandaracinobacteroides hominis]
MKKALTREALLRAGRRLFAAGPVEAISIDAVVIEAGVSKGSFYNYFTDRQELVEAVVGDVRNHLHSIVVRVNEQETDAAKRVARAVCVFLRYAVEEPEGSGALARIHGTYLSVDAPFNEPLVADIRRGLASGRFRIPTLDAGVLLVIGIVQVGLISILQERNPALAVSKSQQLVMMMLRGLGVESDEANQMAAQMADEIVGVGLPAAVAY